MKQKQFKIKSKVLFSFQKKRNTGDKRETDPTTTIYQTTVTGSHF